MENEQFEELGRRLREIAAELRRLEAEVKHLRNAIASEQGQKEAKPGDQDTEKP